MKSASSVGKYGNMILVLKAEMSQNKPDVDFLFLNLEINHNYFGIMCLHIAPIKNHIWWPRPLRFPHPL